MLRSLVGFLVITCIARVSRAQDAFEIQVYDTESTPAGVSGLELHVNAGGDRFTRFTLEPHVGLSSWLEAGAYLQTALRPDGGFDYAGVKLRLKGRAPRRLWGLVGVGINLEISSVPRPYEDGLGVELRPIVDLEWRRLYLSVNPIWSVDFKGGFDFEPASKLSVRVIRPIAVGAEYYGAARAGVNRILGAVDVTYGRIGINLGAGYGFGENRWLAKAILGLEIQ